MKTRLLLLMVIALVAAACASSSEATPGTGLARAAGSEIPTTTRAPSAGETPTTTTTGSTATSGALPTNPIDSGTGNTEVPVPLVVEPCDPPTENLEPYCEPFELVLGNTTIIWDRWFWGQGTFSKGTVEVYHGDELVAAGPFVGEGSIVEQADDNSFIFYDAAGEVVAVAKPEEITPAIQAALDGLDS